jgi:hypothetical protein
MHYEGDKPKTAEDRQLARTREEAQANVYCEEQQWAFERNRAFVYTVLKIRIP